VGEEGKPLLIEVSLYSILQAYFKRSLGGIFIFKLIPLTLAYPK